MKCAKLTEAKLQNAIDSDIGSRNHSCIIPNIYLPRFGNESDLVSITNTGYLWEYEIKITKNDFYADRRKYRHERYLDSESATDRKPNRFWYVVPAGKENGKFIPLIEPKLMPVYAGLIGVYESTDTTIPERERGPWVRKIKSAPLLHKEKATIEQVMKIADVARGRMWKLRYRIRALEYELRTGKEYPEFNESGEEIQ